MLSQYQLQYQIAPIILTRGIASSGGGLSIMSILGGASSIDDAFAIFQPLVGGTLVEQTIGQYPFANQSIAGNAMIRQPLTLSMIMITPQKQANSWSTKLSLMSALKTTLDAHNNAGGTFTVMTPSYYYTDLVMIALVDMSTPETVLPQNGWRWDFQKPLISLADAQSAQNNLMSKITSGLPTSGNWTGTNIGQASVPAGPDTTTGLGGTSGLPPSSNSQQTYDPLSSIQVPGTVSGTTEVGTPLQLGPINPPAANTAPYPYSLGPTIAQ